MHYLERLGFEKAIFVIDLLIFGFANLLEEAMNLTSFRQLSIMLTHHQILSMLAMILLYFAISTSYLFFSFLFLNFS